jgi:thymidylate synthase ThyX
VNARNDVAEIASEEDERGRAYHAKILLDSIGPSGKRITTFELRYPRFVHAELMTHRLFSRNSASSRAIPIERLIAQVVDEPAMPVWWGKNQAGMQAREELTGEALGHARRVWLAGRDEAVATCRALASYGAHKQIANRLIEPWMFITVLVTATEYDNWFGLRDHPDAQPEIAWIARLMREARDLHEPAIRRAGEWHLPLLDQAIPGGADCGESWDLEVAGRSVEDLKLISAGRCARVSYLTHDGKRDVDADIALARRLATSGHWSPFEHVAQAMREPIPSGNFVGWKQFRKEFQNEHIGGPRA